MTVEEWLGKDNQIGIDIWNKKYRNKEETFDEWVDRVSGHNDEVAELILSKRFLFGGRILANRGLANEKKITYSNCYVVPAPEDNLESIFDCAKQLARTYSYGGGCGTDLSKLCPKGATVRNAAKESSGAVSFMDLYSMVTGLISQNGRRGALMISMSCDHPDIMEFIDIKNDLSKVNFANISVRMTDAFLKAVECDADFTMRFQREETGEVTEQTIRAKDLMHKLAENNWKTGEPGMLFWDRIEKYNLLSETKEFSYAGTNPCGEEPLPAFGSCNLGSINLAEFVTNPFTQNAQFDFTAFLRTVSIAIDALNEVLDEGMELHPLKEQRESVRDWRQCGLGIMGLADMLIKMGVRYGSEESIKLCDEIGHYMARIAIAESSSLAEKYGAYPKCNPNEIVNTEYFKAHRDYEEHILKYGLRNSQLLTVAPTGTLSTMLGISGGIEPIFANYYERTTKSLHGKDVTYKVYTPIVQRYMSYCGLTDEYQLPEYFVTAQKLDYHQRIDMQSVWQKHIDASISSTVNLPNETTVEEVADLYMYAWKKGLKGITVFRDGCDRVGILNTGDKHVDSPVELKRGMIMDVPSDLTYRKYKLHTGCGTLYLFVGVDDDGKIYDLFTNTDGVGGCTINTQANSRLISACIRSGVPIEYIIEQLNKAGTCPSFSYAKGKGKDLSAGKSCASAIAHVLRDILNESAQDDEEHIEPEEKIIQTEKEYISTNVCPECGSQLNHTGGCIQCPTCNWSKCSG